MPIYAYRCTSCGHAKDVLQKVSDPLLTECPACGAATFAKQVTAAGFQLKGSGWYVTDFRGGANAGGKAEGDGGADKAAEKPSDKSSEGGDKGQASTASAAPAPASASPAPAAAKAPAPAASSPAPAAPAPAPSSSGR
ncbi:MAG: zinc ribbon domain-containing protein [Rubrivivax sp.]|nr:zinc ribbon domain-containing protein [Rubrivivax sp.]